MEARRNPAVVSKAMRAVRSKDTRPERALRAKLWHRGARYRLNSKLIGRPDLVFTSARVAIFVDGDFWHGRQWITRGFQSLEAQMSRVNDGSYWVAKLKRTIARDEAVTRALETEGWTVIRLWESDVLRSPDEAAGRVLSAVGKQI